MKHDRSFPTRHRSLEEILFWWPQITNTPQSDWSRGFAQSVLAQSRRRTWRPTPKQFGIMQRMAADWFAGVLSQRDDGEVIE